MPDPITELRPLARRMVLRAATTLLVTALARRPSAAAEIATVVIANFTFAPAEIAVAPGTTVTWTNHDDIPHTVTSSDGAFKSRALDTDESFSFTFARSGSHQYFCSLHPHMVGAVTVG